MTEAAKELQINAVKALVNLAKSSKSEITFKAPTGSGKTFMMAKFMNEMLKNEDLIFIVSSLSKGDLAKQNFDSFEKFSRSDFKNLRPYLISSEISSEERLNIPLGYNVYVLPRDLYKEKSRLKSGAFLEFLENFKANIFENRQEKKVILIKDECHIATSNLDDLKRYFHKILNFSATPDIKKGQKPDIEISEIDAVSANLIKNVEFFEEFDNEKGLNSALKIFCEYKEKYEKIGINPAMIIQISNKERAETEIKLIKQILNKNFSDLKWVLFVENEKNCDTNDTFKAKKLPVKKWKNYAKENTSSIDIIIFKMVISEGWDIPRAFMLYQMRDSKSKQLDEQVIGRVRRNPRLLDFENLEKSAQNLISTAFVYGVKPKENKIFKVELKGQINENLFENEIIKEFSPFKSVKLQGQASKMSDEDLRACIKEKAVKSSIFELHRKFKVQNNELFLLAKNFIKNYQNYFDFMQNLDEINKKLKAVLSDFDNAKIVEFSAPQIASFYAKSEFTVRLKEWIWDDGSENRFSFDSEAERKFCELLQDLALKFAKILKIGKNEIYLFGKNFPNNSNMKFEYFNEESAQIHTSFPDFIFKDKSERIHIFEVKSVNFKQNSNVDKSKYEQKIIALKNGYQNASKILPYIFYLPILQGEKWIIDKIQNGEIEKLTQLKFEESFS